MQRYIGTSGFAYKEWRGSFYPEDIKDSDMLSFYAAQFNAVEINNTFYRMPSEKVLSDWAADVPSDFRFVLKASRQITHIKRLKEGVAEPLEYFLRNARVLGDRLGPILVQLPPNLKLDLDRLRVFLDLLPTDVRFAFEFRHNSWHDDAVFDALRSRNAALCIAHTKDGETPFVPTASWGYVRLRKVQYTDADLASWRERIASAPWTDVHVFFKHEEEATGPALARRFQNGP